MKLIFSKTLLLLTVFSTIVSCNNSSEQTKSSSKKELSYSNNNTTLQWTAYKTTDKIGVKGTFKSIVVENNSKAETIEDIINSTKFKIATSSVNTGNPPRDLLIKNYFFGAMLNTDTISGNFSSAKDGLGKVSIKMNNVAFSNDFTYSVNNDTLKIHATLQLDDWNGYSALASLHEQCFDKHKGPDGVSKTWSDVDLEIVSVFKSN